MGYGTQCQWNVSFTVEVPQVRRASEGSGLGQRVERGIWMSHQARGDFVLTRGEPTSDDEAAGTALGRIAVSKVFQGDLAETSEAQLLTVHDRDGRPAVYVGIERVTGSLNGLEGTFVLHHTAPGTAGEPMVIRIMGNTATGTLAGLSGTLSITGNTENGHTYTIDYDLPDD